jgi:hypothetical protein
MLSDTESEAYARAQTDGMPLWYVAEQALEDVKLSKQMVYTISSK